MSNLKPLLGDFPGSLVVRNPPSNAEDRGSTPGWGMKICWKRDRLPTPVVLGFPYGSAGKESALNVGDLGCIPGLGRSREEGKGLPLQYSGLENSMECTVHGVAKKSDTTEQLSLSLFPFTLSFKGGWK